MLQNDVWEFIDIYLWQSLLLNYKAILDINYIQLVFWQCYLHQLIQQGVPDPSITMATYKQTTSAKIALEKVLSLQVLIHLLVDNVTYGVLVFLLQHTHTATDIVPWHAQQ